jgi:hypothetical protein
MEKNLYLVEKVNNPRIFSDHFQIFIQSKQNPMNCNNSSQVIKSSTKVINFMDIFLNRTLLYIIS